MTRRPTTRRSGVASVEFAIILPILTALLFGIWEIGRMVQVSQVLINAAREAARQASTGTSNLSTIKSNVQTYVSGAEPRVTNFTGFDVTFTDVTRSTVTDPTGATQLDRFTITVVLPFDNVRWSVIKQFVPAGTNLRASVDWYSMKDLPVTVTTGMPVE